MALSEFLFVNRCPVCKRKQVGFNVCAVCRASLAKAKNPSAATVRGNMRTYTSYSLYPYENPTVKKYLFALKRSPTKELVRFAAHDIAENLIPILPKNAYTVCFAPRGKKNVRIYGADHMKLVSKQLAKSVAYIDYEKLLSRRGFTKEQKELGFDERRENLKGKITASKKDSAKEILILDDIITSASTFISCADALLCANPDAHVTGIFIATAQRSLKSAENV